jgi:hypothetical protein
MPRNTIGGSRAKKQGNKNSGGGGGGGGQYAGVRRAGEGEAYAVAVRVYGGGRAEVVGNDGVKRRLEIRGKFKGRNRRHNEVKPGGLLLVGDRAWTINPTSSNQQERVCDLLCVYDAEETRTLRREGTLNAAMLKQATSKFDDSADDGVRFDSTSAAVAKQEVVEDDGFDPYAGMPGFSDEEGEDEGTAAAPTHSTHSPPSPLAEPAAPAPAKPAGKLWDDDEEVDADDI